MAPELYEGAMPIGYTRRGVAVLPISGGADDAGAAAGATPAGDGGDGATSSAGEEATKLLEAFKASGIEEPGKAMETIQKLRAFERGEQLPRKVSKQIEELQSKLKEFEDRDKSEGERLSGRVSELEAELAKREEALKGLTVERVFSAAAAKAGALYPDDTAKLVNLSKAEYDDDGQLKNAEALIEELKASRPALFGKGSAPSFDGGARTSAPGAGPGMNDLLHAAAKGT